MRLPIILVLLLFGRLIHAQQTIPDPVEEILIFQTQLNEQFQDTASSPLPAEVVELFTEHEFFPVNLKYRVEAELIKTPDAPAFEMPTTTSRKPLYRQFAIAIFQIDGVGYSLALYQSLNLIEKEGYNDYLFLPFKDYTNGFESYGGGRYIDLKIPEGDKIVIDFNKSYNPYCAYSDRFSCPIPPDENSLPLRVEAGIMYRDH